MTAVFLPPVRSVRHRALAAVVALTVFALGLFAVAPGLHAALHGHGHAHAAGHDGHHQDHAHDHGHSHDHGADAEHFCAIDLFAAGVVLAAVAALLRPVAPLVVGLIATPASPVVARTTWRLRPGRAPPFGRI